MDYLKQKGPESGQSAYEQIKDLLLKLFKERPPQKRVYNEFEELTQQLGDITLPVGTCMATELDDLRECFSQLQFNPRKELNPEEGEAEEGEAEENPDEAEAEPEEAEAPELVDVNTQNLPEVARILQTKGFGFTQLDAYRLQKAINDMAKQYEIAEDEIKLFGRVGPYWVLRTTAALPEAEEEEAEAENAEEEEGDADGGDNPGEEAPEDEDDELRALKAQWDECKAQMEADKEAEKAAAGGGEEAQEGEAPAEPEGGDAEGGEGEGEGGEGAEGEEVMEAEPAAEGGEGEPAEGEAQEQEGEAAEETKEKEPSFHSELSFEDDLKPETKVPKRVCTVQGQKFPLKKIKAVPTEEGDGLNKYAFYAAIDSGLSELGFEIYRRLFQEYEATEFRIKNKLKYAKSRFHKMYKKLFAKPLSFVPLPIIKPDQVRALATMPGHAVHFTGDLQAKVKSSLPPFNGTEAHLLKCVCVKIMHSYTVVPKKLFNGPEEEAEEENKLVLDKLDAKAKQVVKQRMELLKISSNKRISEIMFADPTLYKYGEDETQLELTAAFAEPNEEFRGYENVDDLLNLRQWGYLYPRINGQGRCLEINADDYDGLDDPEPAEFAVAEERMKRKRAEIKQRIEDRKKQREDEKIQKQCELSKAKYQAWLEGIQEKWQEQDDADNAALEELAEPVVEEDEFDDTEKPEKPEVTTELPYDELQKYYTTRLWRKLRVFKRPVAPWDRSILDNRPNVLLPDLLIKPGQLDRTRVDFKQKCTYHVDEAAVENECAFGNTKVPLWSFEALPEQGAVVALNSRCLGAINFVYGQKYLKHEFLYFGDGVDQVQAENPAILLPDMCEFPMELNEVPEVEPTYQRMEFQVLEDRKRKAEEKLRREKEAAEEKEEKDEKEEEE